MFEYRVVVLYRLPPTCIRMKHFRVVLQLRNTVYNDHRRHRSLFGNSLLPDFPVVELVLWQSLLHRTRSRPRADTYTPIKRILVYYSAHFANLMAGVPTGHTRGDKEIQRANDEREKNCLCVEGHDHEACLTDRTSFQLKIIGGHPMLVPSLRSVKDSGMICEGRQMLASPRTDIPSLVPSDSSCVLQSGGSLENLCPLN